MHITKLLRLSQTKTRLLSLVFWTRLAKRQPRYTRLRGKHQSWTLLPKRKIAFGVAATTRQTVSMRFMRRRSAIFAIGTYFRALRTTPGARQEALQRRLPGLFRSANTPCFSGRKALKRSSLPAPGGTKLLHMRLTACKRAPTKAWSLLTIICFTSLAPGFVFTPDRCQSGYLKSLEIGLFLTQLRDGMRGNMSAA